MEIDSRQPDDVGIRRACSLRAQVMTWYQRKANTRSECNWLHFRPGSVE